MKAFRREPDSVERGQVEISDELGYVWLEAHDLEALEAVMCALNERDDLIAQRDALVKACEAAEKYLEVMADVYVLQTGTYSLLDILSASETLSDQNSAALELVRGKGE